MSTLVSVGEWIAQRRKMLDLTQRELAARANCALATIKKIESDERRPSRELARALAGALHIPADMVEVFVACARGLRAVDNTLTAVGEDGNRSQHNSRAIVPIVNLPAHSTPFIGREMELKQIVTFLADPTCRLLTLVGPGGIGKTRLAVEVASLQQAAFANSVYLVALQALSSPDYIVPAIAEAMRFQFYPGGEPKQQLFDYLREKSLLLVLDNFEHLLDGVELVSEMLTYAPAVKILATSRERLNLVEEWVLNVEGLPIPASEADMEIDDYGAVQIFLQSAQRVQVGFILTDAQKPAVTHICQLVAGMPLALELAATWVRVLPCAEIAAEMQRSLDFLATNLRDMPERHRSMRAVFDHSWKLLAEAERDVFKRLSAFRGGFRREAAERAAGATLRTLTALVDKSLLRVDANGRYDVHELLRQYAEEQLSPDESDQVREAHGKYYADFLAQRWEHLRSHRQRAAMNDIESEVAEGGA